MVEITAGAQRHFRRLLDEQGEDDFGIHIGVVDGGTPAASVDIGFCEPGDLLGNELAIRCDGFVLHVAADSVTWLEQARIDFDEQGGRMRIAAPGLRGQVPEADAGLVARIGYVIESEINPQLAAHSGQVKLVDIDPGNVAVLEFGGGCHGCGMVDVTLKQGVEKTLRRRVPELAGVRDATEHAKGTSPYYRGQDGASAMARER